MSKRFAFISLALLGFALAALQVGGDLSRGMPTNVLLLTLADAPGPGPHLTEIAEHGTVFAYHGDEHQTAAVGPAKVFTAAEPDAAVNDAVGQPLADLAAAGYLVEGIQDFMNEEPFVTPGLLVSETTDDLFYRLARHRRDLTPFILWYHYDSTLDTFDAWFLSLWRHVSKSGLRRTTVLMLLLAADDERGSTTAEQPADGLETLGKQPALIIWLPPAIRERLGTTEPVVEARAGDIMPTLFALLDQPFPDAWPGRSLWPIQDAAGRP